jgi:hypothetical protein
MKKILLITTLFTIGFSAVAQVNLSKSPNIRKEILNEQYASSLFKNAEGTIIDVENETVQGYLNILDWLNGRVAGLQIFVTRSGIRVPVIRGSAATIFVDEIQMDPSYLNFISVNDIGMIKVIKGPFAGAIGNGGGGTIAIYTIRADDDEEEEDSK